MAEFVSQPLREAVSWNVHRMIIIHLDHSQPLREAVSWNVWMIEKGERVPSSASSWGCELKCNHFIEYSMLPGQPLREAVSWNALNPSVLIPRQSSASSWGCELKFRFGASDALAEYRQPLREAVSWNNGVLSQKQSVNRQPLREAVSWNNSSTLFPLIWLSSASSWGCELK